MPTFGLKPFSSITTFSIVLLYDADFFITIMNQQTLAAIILLFCTESLLDATFGTFFTTLLMSLTHDTGTF